MSKKATNAQRKTKPELMSPAGGEAQMRAAVEAGADAVYFGLEGFNARAKAMAFNHENLNETVAWLHGRGVQSFVAVNTLAFDNELKTLERELIAVAESGADAIIVQDVGVLKLAREIAPELRLHASTQMSITSSEGANFAKSLGVSRVVLARELSLADIASVRAQTKVELEVFVHGALCVSYSGQCFSSEAWGGRSANRGACAQACRLPYELMVDGAQQDLHDARYLLSPQDLFALEQIPELVNIGVDCFKIEGRYKDEDYVAATTAAYRQAIDAAWQNTPHKVTGEEILLLEGVYSRGLLPAFMQGVNHQTVVNGRAPRHRGVLVGEVTGFTRGGVLLRLDPRFLDLGGVLYPGDGMVFDAADWRSPGEPEEGGPLYEIFATHRSGGARLHDSYGQREIELRFGNNRIRYNRIQTGDWLWRTHDPSIEKNLRQYTNQEKILRRQTTHWQVAGSVGTALELTITDGTHATTVQSGEPLKAASNRPLDDATLARELGKLGETPFVLGEISNNISGDVFMPLSEFGKLRRQACEQLLTLRQTPVTRTVHKNVLEKLQTPTQTNTENTVPKLAAPKLSVLVRQPAQLEAAIQARPDEIILDYLDLYGLRPSVERILEAGISASVASPRILKPNEERIHKFLLSLPANILVRSPGLLNTLLNEENKPELHGDFSLNAANAIAAQEFLNMGLARLAPTHDLNAAQILALAQHINAAQLEVIAYHHLPVFHTEHCVFCKFLSEGTDHTNCGHPCETHNLALRDERGLSHPVLADVGCRNTVFEARAQTGAKFFTTWQHAGIGTYRLEFVQETPEQVQQVIAVFQAALVGKTTDTELERELSKASPQGITLGSFIVPEGLALLPMV